MGEIKDTLKSLGNEALSPVYYPTGCLLLDMVLGGAPGCFGIRGGVLTGIFGVNSAGKSFLCGEAIAASKQKYPKLAWDYQDIERRFRFDTRKLYGLQIIPDGHKTVETIEELDAHLGLWLEDNEFPAIFVTDSLDALSNEDAEESSQNRMDAYEKDKEVVVDASYGTGPAKFLSQHFFKTKMSKVSKTNAALLFLSQVRENLGKGNYGPKHKRSGGTALDHWCDTTLKLQVIHKIKSGSDDRVVGVVVEATTTKSSTGRPFRSCRYTLYFDYGIDDIGSCLDYLFDLRGDDGKIKAAANEVVWSGIPRSLETVKKFLEENDALDRVKEARKAQKLRGNLNVNWALEWIPEQQDLLPAFEERFGNGLTASKDELIALIEADPKMRQELRERTIAKWEASEAEIAVGPHRQRKYQ